MPPFTRRDLPVYVINLGHRKDRWRFQTAQAKLHRSAIQRVAAMDGRAGRDRFPNADPDLSGGELGIWATFDGLVSRLASEGVQAAVVLEDDAVLCVGFHHKAKKIYEGSSIETALVQLGFLTESTWRPYLTITQNIKKVLRPRSRFKVLRNSSARDRPQSAAIGIRGGSHAMLIFPERLLPYLPELRPEKLNGPALDMAFIAASQKYPDVFIRARRSLAGQLPLKSDIQERSRRS